MAVNKNKIKSIKSMPFRNKFANEMCWGQDNPFVQYVFRIKNDQLALWKIVICRWKSSRINGSWCYWNFQFVMKCCWSPHKHSSAWMVQWFKRFWFMEKKYLSLIIYLNSCVLCTEYCLINDKTRYSKTWPNTFFILDQFLMQNRAFT